MGTRFCRLVTLIEAKEVFLTVKALLRYLAFIKFTPIMTQHFVTIEKNGSTYFQMSTPSENFFSMD